MSAAEMIAMALQGQRSGNGWWRCVCPVRGSRTGRSPTLALRDGNRGLIVDRPIGPGNGKRPVIAASPRR